VTDESTVATLFSARNPPLLIRHRKVRVPPGLSRRRWRQGELAARGATVTGVTRWVDLPSATVVGMTSEEMIATAGAALAAALPPPSRVILFGSHARGQADGGSDLDLLVIEPEVQDAAAESARLRRVLHDIPAAIDVVVVSEELARRRARVPETMVDRALSEGRVIAQS
jgi:predicted nucleotidyltransferase